MTCNRHIHVFYKADGKCILEKSWDEDGANRGQREFEQQSIPSASLWPLIQVFVQFAREVQGGAVKRLVFRNPEEYAPAVKRFQPVPRKRKDKNPVIVHVAHDDIFAVAVTELLQTDCGGLGLVRESEQAAGITIAEFCESVLNYLNKEQTSFLATLRSEDFEIRQGARVGNSFPALANSRGAHRQEGGLGQPEEASFASNGTGDADSDGNHAERNNARNMGPSTTAGQPTVTINESRLSDFISKTQNLLST